MTLDLQNALRTARTAAYAAGEVLLSGLGSNDLNVRSKSHRHDPVTLYDLRADETIRSVIAREFPSHAVLSEESGQAGDAEARTWVIDPLDGTNNYLRGIPHFAVSIALRSRDTLLVACVHDPVRSETFTAVAGAGAKRNGSAIRVSTQSALDGAAVAVGFSYDPERRVRTLDEIPGWIEEARALRATGSAALDLAYVAAGRFDVAWYLALSAWDVAAGILLIREAGGRATDLAGEPLVDPLDGLVASNGLVHDAFLAALRRSTR